MSIELDQAILDLIEGAPSAESAALIAGAPSTSPPPVDLNAPFDVKADGLGLTEAELVAAGVWQPVVTAEPLAPVPESWRACTGPDVTAMIKASQAGFVRTPGFTRADVLAFLAAKGL